jgi:hypothetical protein
MFLPALVTGIEKGITDGIISSTGLPMPFTQEILLLECHVAGTSFQDLDDVAPKITKGEYLDLRREPGNEHDNLAIEVLTPDKVKLGYIPRAKNEILARLMDAGKVVFAKVESVLDDGCWLEINIGVFFKGM